MSRRALAAVLALAGAVAQGCGSSASPAPVTLEEFPEAFASRFCARAFDCCLPEDQGTAAPGTDVASCTAEMTANARNNATLLLGFTGVGYFAGAARHCVDVLDHGSCAAIFSAGSGVLVACQDVFAGTEALGATCEDDRQCVSGACGSHVCVAAAACSASQVVSDTNACLPRVDLGAPCTVSGQCPAGAGCGAGVCKQRGGTGAACSNSDECLGACSTSTGVSVCRAPYCAGP